MWTYGFRFYFTPLPRFFSPFPHGTFLYRSSGSILPWMVVHPASHRVPRVPWYSGSQPVLQPFVYEGLTLFARPSHAVPLGCFPFLLVLNPESPKALGLGSSLFARRYLGNHYCLLFLRLLRCFSSPGLSPFRAVRHDSHWVAPFGYPWIEAYLRLPTAFRSLSRPSSTPDAKASTVCLS